MAGGESEGHRQLKRGAFLWAQAHGYTACAEEVRLPNSGYRADVVAAKPAREGLPGFTAIFECKWARSDFLGDAASLDGSKDRLQELAGRREVLERNLRVHHPSLRAGESLFPEYDVVDLEKLDHANYRAVLREIQTLQRKIRGGAKFDRVVRYRCADLCYLVVRKGICDPPEIPLGWGLLEWDEESVAGDADGETPDSSEGLVPALRLAVRPQKKDCGEGTRLELLCRIAAAATRFGNRHLKIPATLPFGQRRRNMGAL